MGRRGAKGFDITSLPYRVKVYINNQVLIPAKLVRALKITDLRYARVKFRVVKNGAIVELPRVKLLRTRNTDSRQFTIPKEVREKYDIKPNDEVEVLEITRAVQREERGQPQS